MSLITGRSSGSFDPVSCATRTVTGSNAPGTPVVDDGHGVRIRHRVPDSAGVVLPTSTGVAPPTSATVPSLVRPSRKRKPSISPRQTSVPWSAGTSSGCTSNFQRVPENGAPVCGTRRTRPATVSPSRNHGPPPPVPRHFNAKLSLSPIMYQRVPVNGSLVVSESPTLWSPVRPSRKRAPSPTTSPRQKIITSLPVTRMRHRVPLNAGPVSGARPTLPSMVRPSRNRAPSACPRQRSVKTPSATSDTAQHVPLCGGKVVGARCTD